MMFERHSREKQGSSPRCRKSTLSWFILDDGVYGGMSTSSNVRGDWCVRYQCRVKRFEWG